MVGTGELADRGVQVAYSLRGPERFDALRHSVDHFVDNYSCFC